MTATTRRVASAAVGGLLVVGIASLARAQGERLLPVASRSSAFASGAIQGVVLDDRGVPVAGAVVVARGGTTTTAITDRTGRFELARLTPGPYHLRARCAGFVAPREAVVQVTSSGPSTSSIALRRNGAVSVLAAGVGATEDADVIDPAPITSSTVPSSTDGDPSETTWRLRHARRSVLKEVTIPDDLLVTDRDTGNVFAPADLLGRAVGSPARAATAFFSETSFSGQVNLFTTGSFDTPRELFSTDLLSRNIAYLRVGAPVGQQGDWSVRGAVTETDISSWIVAGSYTSRPDATARHQYDIGLAYSTQRYDGSNVLALRSIPDGSRSVGTVHAIDNVALGPSATMSYGATYSRYDYLDGGNLLSPRMALTVRPADGVRVSAVVSRAALAPGAEEFLPPGESGMWLPPQRTFSWLSENRPFTAERTTHAEVGLEGDLGHSTLGIRAFHQHVDDQLVTMFGANLPGQPAARLGHYLVGNTGDVDATGYAASWRAVMSGRVQGSVEYSMANAQMAAAADDLMYLVLLAPSAARQGRERVHDVTATIETEVPETATRVFILYRVGNGYAHGAQIAGDAASGIDSRFDLQIHQSLPFMNFSNARWEMLVGVHNFFHENGGEHSVYDERLVIRPPKRVVGGVTLRF